MASATDLTEGQVRLALAYPDEYPDEIDAWVRDSERPLAELRREYPAIDPLVTD